ncbi:MAG: leucine-rich repeat domain-containing protein [Microcoleaceae cyanobacterium]
MERAELLALIDQAAEEGWKELDLAGKELTELPPEIGKLTQLETLTLGKWDEEKRESIGNQLTTLPPEITALVNLKTLNLHSNPIKEIPECIGQLANLKELYLWKNPIKEIPEFIGQLANLKELYLGKNQITEIPEFIGQLTNLTELYLGKNQITEIPEFIGQLTNLTKLYLWETQITEIPEFIGQLTNLTALSLSDNPIKEIPEFIGQLTNLTELHLWKNQITEIPEFIGQLTNLKELYLSDNQITEIPEFIGQLTNLTQLRLSDNQITEIPEFIGQLTNLTALHLGKNQITEIPECIGQLTNLKELHLWENQIKEIPECIGQLTNLTELYLRENQITEIPECIGQLTNLTELHLGKNQITEIPECIGQLANLTVLSLSDNPITEIPECIGQLANLTALSLGGNPIKEIPECIGQLTNLTALHLWKNQITEIPECIGQLTNLTVLRLGGNQITEIPEYIGQLTNLKELSLNDNPIKEIPECIGQLTNLTQLRIGGNQIKEIPECIGQLTNLTELSLWGNQISEIPECIGQLTNLTELDLWDNQIKAIPICLENLPNLKALSLANNPLPISPELLADSENPEAIFDYCRRLRGGEVRPLNEAKLLLVGQGSVGKTSLINRLIHEQFDQNEPQTDGLNVTEWRVHVNSKDVRLNVWDFGGQEIYHATHQFFLTKRSLYLLVCNCRTSEEANRIEYWLQLIQGFGDESPVIIVGNKCDEQPLDINRRALQEKYPNIKAILETSCQENRGIEELREAITQEIAELRNVYDLLPLSWFEVKEELERLDKDFIPYEKYVCICDRQDITEESDQEQLVKLLHDLGLVLNFRDHPILQSTNVLNPDWVTAGIYKLLSDEQLKTEGKGILTGEDLSRVLDPERYPAKRYIVLTELMKEFQLGFQVLDQPGTFLIPGLLPKEEPKETDLEGDTLEFQYHYAILPGSILSRFIVLSHEKIHNQIHWRTGVMLAYREGTEICNIARVKSDPEDRKIFISINGRESTRRSFLAMIRDVFQSIHSSFGNLQVGEWVPVPGHPEHAPLDYQELLGLEAMGEKDYPIGKLRIRVNLRQLLDGYEPLESRQRKQMKEQDREFMEGRHFEDRYPGGIHINVHQSNQPTTKTTNNLQGSTVGNFANKVEDNARQQA